MTAASGAIAQGDLEEIIAHLGAALIQRAYISDSVIENHIAAAYEHATEMRRQLQAKATGAAVVPVMGGAL